MGRGKDPLTDEERKVILGVYRRTSSLRATSRAAHRSEALVRQALEEAGVEYQTRDAVLAAKLAQVPATYRALGSHLKTASFLQLGTAQVKRALDEAGIEWKRTRREGNAVMRDAIARHAVERGLKG